MSNPVSHRMSNPVSNRSDPAAGRYQLPGIGSRIAALVRQLFVSQLRTTLTSGAVLGALGNALRAAVPGHEREHEHG